MAAALTACAQCIRQRLPSSQSPTAGQGPDVAVASPADAAALHEAAGQEPLATGSRIATHSTWCVIGKTSEGGGPDVFAGQSPFVASPKDPTDARSVKRASRPRHELASAQRGSASARRWRRPADVDPHPRDYAPRKAME